MGAIGFLKSIRKNVLYNAAVSANKIREFSEEIDNNLRNTIYTVLPSIIYLKYERPMNLSGNSMERAYLLSIAVPDSYVVVGDVDGIGEHYWVETLETVYDPTSLLEYDKDVYYVLNTFKSLQVITREELDQTGFIQFCRRRQMQDFQTDSTYFYDLETILPFIQNGIKYRALPEYKKEIDDYLEKLEYYQKKDELLRYNLFRNL